MGENLSGFREGVWEQVFLGGENWPQPVPCESPGDSLGLSLR